MRLEIVTPDTVLFTGDQVNLIQLPGLDGSFEILTDHAPLISILKKGRIKVSAQGEKDRFFEVNGGVVEVMSNKVLVLAE